MREEKERWYPELEKRLDEQELEIICALVYYFSHFKGDGTGKTFGEATRSRGLNPADVIYYRFYLYRKEGITLGEPDTREEAQTYLANALDYLNSLRSRDMYCGL